MTGKEMHRAQGLDEPIYLLAYSGMGSVLSVTPQWKQELASYSQWLRAGSVPVTTLKLRLYHLKRFAATSGLEPLTPAFEDLLVHIGNHRWSANTKRSVRSTLRSFYKWALLTGRIDKNPAHDLPEISAPIGKPRPAPEAAISQGLTAPDQRVRRMVAFAAWAGLRCCEIAVIHTRDLVLEPNGWSLRVHGKGDKLRVVPLVDRLAQVIRMAPDGYLFAGDYDGHLSAAYVSKLVSRALPKGWTAHTLRHRFASSAYAADQDIRAVQELLGHASVATTQIYTAVPDGSLRRAAFSAFRIHGNDGPTAA